MSETSFPIPAISASPLGPGTAAEHPSEHLSTWAGHTRPVALTGHTAVSDQGFPSPSLSLESDTADTGQWSSHHCSGCRGYVSTLMGPAWLLHQGCHTQLVGCALHIPGRSGGFGAKGSPWSWKQTMAYTLFSPGGVFVFPANVLRKYFPREENIGSCSSLSMHKPFSFLFS